MAKDSLLLTSDLGIILPPLAQGAVVVSPLTLPIIGSGTGMESGRKICVLGDEQKWLGTIFIYQKLGFSPGQMILTSVILDPSMISKGVTLSGFPALKIGAGTFKLSFTVIPSTALLLAPPFIPDPTPLYTGNGMFQPSVIPISESATESS
jgi:hypothetical protein